MGDKKMRVLLTGAFGNVGLSVLKELLDNNHDIRILEIKISPVVVGGTVGFSFLPVGYIICIFSQWLYYFWIGHKKGVHQIMYEALPDKDFKTSIERDIKAMDKLVGKKEKNSLTRDYVNYC